MAVFQSNQMLAGNQLGSTTGGLRLGPNHGLANSMKILFFEVVAATAILTTDTIEFGMAPKGFVLTGGTVETGNIGAATSVLNIGDSGSATRLLSADTIVQAGGVVQLSAATGIMFKYTDDTLVTGTITIASGDAAGTISVALYGFIAGSGVS